MQAQIKIAPEELFVLTDEQILEIEPEAQDAVPGGTRPVSREERTGVGEHDSAPPNEQRTEASSVTEQGPRSTERAAETRERGAEPRLLTDDVHGKAEPPEWLAQRMRDPWNGEDAREFWDGVKREKEETAAFREVFAKPEEARATAERARVLDEIDQAYFGAQGKPAEEVSAGRTQLAQRMMREDPAAFREMVFAGLRALEAMERPGTGGAISNIAGAKAGEASSAPATSGAARETTASAGQNELVGRYAAFEKAANDDLERSVGVVIEKALEQALPNAGKTDGALKGRLNTTIRQEIEKALHGDQQLGEQVSRLLASRKFDDRTRAQVVRLIGDRAAQLVPSAAKRVLGDWTQTAMSAHRTRVQREDAASSRTDLAPMEKGNEVSRKQSGAAAGQGQRNKQSSGRSDGVARRGDRVDYRKFSDEQILEM